MAQLHDWNSSDMWRYWEGSLSTRISVAREMCPSTGIKCTVFLKLEVLQLEIWYMLYLHVLDMLVVSLLGPQRSLDFCRSKEI
jgi:hypothetical protein